MKISTIVKKLRDATRMTLDDASDSSGLSKGFLSRMERGEYDPRNVSLETIIKLATGFKVRVKDLLDSLSIIDADEPPALNVYLRKKYDIQDEEDIDTIESIISRFRR